MESRIDIPGYELLQEIGAGGMATVYLAVQKSLDRKVAIKVLRTSADESDPERTEKRFLREGRTLAKISHKNVCGIYDIAKVGNIAYIAMEYLEGGTLVDRLRGGMSAGEAIAVVVQVAAALAEAHAQGIVHRDLKPANVMMRGGRVPVLTDFGIARELTADQTKITAENMIVGTPIYMSPEQVSGGDVDGRSDLYSLGIMFHELLTGRPPYQGDTPIAVCMQHLTAPIPTLPPKLADLDPILEKMLAKKREDRYEDMQSFTRALREVFLHSDTLRNAIASNPDVAWSEQLRDLGFSFDTLRDSDLRALQARTARPAAPTQPMQRPARPAAAPKKPATGGRPLPRWLWPAVGGVALLLVAIGVFTQFAGERLSEDQIAALTTMVRQFDDQLAEGRLVQPAQDSALQSLRGMYAISRRHNLVASREEAFRSAVDKRVETLIQSQQYGEARMLLGDARIALGDEAHASRLASLDQAQQAAQREAAIAERAQALEQLLEASAEPAAEALASELGRLRELTGSEDARYTRLLQRVGQRLAGPLQRAIQAEDLQAAQAAQARIASILPDTPQAREAADAVRRLQSQLQAAANLSRVDELLRGNQIGVSGSAEIIDLLGALARAEVPAQRLRQIEDQLVERIAVEAEAARAAGDLMRARSLLDPVLARRSDAAALNRVSQAIEADEQALAAQRQAEEEARRAGRLALDAMPWAELTAVINSAGEVLPLPQQRTTPLVLTLPEGSYRLALKAPDGATSELNATVSRGQLAVARAQLSQPDADQLLREAGYR